MALSGELSPHSAFNEGVVTRTTNHMIKSAAKLEVHPKATALGGEDRTRVIVATVGSEAFIKNRSTESLETWRQYRGDICKAPVMFVDGAPYIRVLDTKGDRVLTSTMVAA